MRLVERLRAGSGLRLPHRTLRFRLTLLYGGLFLVAGAALLTITYLLVDRSTATALFVNSKTGAKIAVQSPPGSPSHSPQIRTGIPTREQLQLAHQLSAQASVQHAQDLHQLLVQSSVALGIMAVLAVVAGWLMAGRVLRPMRSMAIATQRISEHNLHERLALSGPEDEVKALADTIDGLLARIEKAFEAQRRFVANASHELRTPLTLDRALIEVALANQCASAGEFRSVLEDLLASGEQQERLIEALLTLASSERGLDRTERFDLAQLAQRVVSAHQADVDRRALKMYAELSEAPIIGNPSLVERMVANLIENATSYNLLGGRIDVRVEPAADFVVLSVENTGPLVAQENIDRLFRPFQRLEDDRTTHPDGHGLGLSIVQAIATAHDAGIKVRLRPEGGLAVYVHFPTKSNGANASGSHNSRIRVRLTEHDDRRRSPISR
jgi:signal transduction histidine kinase